MEVGGFTIFLIWFCVLGNLTTTLGSRVTITKRDAYFAGHVYERLPGIGWLHCALACEKQPRTCVSYNFNTQNGDCELSRSGVQKTCDLNDILVFAPGVIFQQLRESSEIVTPRKNHQEPCDCRCQARGACVTSISDAAISCKDIWEHRGIRTNGPQYIRGHTPGQKSHVYCHMTELPECGDGGWTLVMKINGAKSTFAYGSSMWTNKSAYNAHSGTDLSQQETKLPSYWTTPFTSLCLGMKHDDTTKWIKVDYAAPNLYNVISRNQFIETKVSLEKWKSLLPNASLQEHCTKQGFNCNDTAKARIGIIGFNTCSSTSHSRIGFGTAGSFMGMNDSNSCGNENSDQQSIIAFGYIFVK